MSRRVEKGRSDFLQNAEMAMAMVTRREVEATRDDDEGLFMVKLKGSRF